MHLKDEKCVQKFVGKPAQKRHLAGKHVGKIPLAIPRHSWKDNIKKDIR